MSCSLICCQSESCRMLMRAPTGSCILLTAELCADRINQQRLHMQWKSRDTISCSFLSSVCRAFTWCSCGIFLRFLPLNWNHQFGVNWCPQERPGCPQIKSRAEDHRMVSMVMLVMKADQEEEEESLSQQNSPHAAGQKDQKQIYRNQNHKNTKPEDLSHKPHSESEPHTGWIWVLILIWVP